MERDVVRMPPQLEAIVARTESMGFNMASEPRTGAFLRTLAASKPSGRFLELGTGTGIATAWLLAGMDSGSRLTSVDTDPEVQGVAREFLESDSRLKLILEDGLAFLRKQASASYDFVFADAMPGKYDGLRECLRVVKPGGIYVVDDMLPQPNWPPGHAEKVPPFIQELAGDRRFEIVPVTWATGLIVAVRRSTDWT
jgi:predicted O-methyltransferase YrrM